MQYVSIFLNIRYTVIHLHYMQFLMFIIFEYSKILLEQLQILKQRSPARTPRVVDGVIFLPIKINFLLRIDFLLSDRLFLNEKGRI